VYPQPRAISAWRSTPSPTIGKSAIGHWPAFSSSQLAYNPVGTEIQRRVCNLLLLLVRASEADMTVEVGLGFLVGMLAGVSFTLGFLLLGSSPRDR
jgi:hypothetical protein